MGEERSGPDRGAGAGGQPEVKGGAAAPRGAGLDVPVVAADDRVDGGQPQPVAGLLGGEIRIEDAGEYFGAHADAGVGDGEFQIAAGGERMG